MKKPKSKSQKLRMAVQALFLMLSIYLFMMLIMGKYHAAHAFCPYAPVCFGMLKIGFMGNMLILFSGAIVLGLLVCISVIFIGRKFCGYICPFGTIQELIYSFRSKKYKMTNKISFFYEYRFRWLKYLILAATAGLAIMGWSYIYMKFCPVMTIAGFPRLLPPGIVILCIILGLGYVTERFWCRFLCPMAALMNLFQFIGNLFGFKRKQIYRNMESCIDCSICSRNCPMNIDIQCNEYITDYNCIHCLKCTSCCPKPGTLTEQKYAKDKYEQRF